MTVLYCNFTLITVNDIVQAFNKINHSARVEMAGFLLTFSFSFPNAVLLQCANSVISSSESINKPYTHARVQQLFWRVASKFTYGMYTHE